MKKPAPLPPTLGDYLRANFASRTTPPKLAKILRVSVRSARQLVANSGGRRLEGTEAIRLGRALGVSPMVFLDVEFARFKALLLAEGSPREQFFVVVAALHQATRFMVAWECDDPLRGNPLTAELTAMRKLSGVPFRTWKTRKAA